MGNLTSQTSSAPRGSSGAQPPANPLLNFMPMIVICAILYILVIRPQQRQAKEQRQMVDNLKNGDRVLTQGGIYGTVVSLKGTSVTVKIAENVKVEVSRSAITQVINENNNGQGEPTTVISGETRS
jgi:preprotein translocase subunit YajC